MTYDPRAVLTRPAPPPDFTVAYGDGPDQIADVRLPVTGRPWGPLVIFIHGGFWMAEYDRSHAGPLAADLAGRGHPVVTLEYRRVTPAGGGWPEAGGWPETFDDVATGLEALPELLAVALGVRGEAAIDTGAPILAGHSAGGQLALWAGKRLGPGRIGGVVALAPVADMARGYELGLGDDAVRLLLGGGPGDVAQRYAAVDPAANLPLGVPVVVVHGRRDMQVPYEIGRDWVRASVTAGDDARFVELPDTEHFGLIDPLSPAWPTVLDALASVGTSGRG